MGSCSCNDSPVEKDTPLEVDPKVWNKTPPEETVSTKGKRQLSRPKLDECVFQSGPEYFDCVSLAENLKESLVVDVRGADFFGGHIPGAVRLPFEHVLEKPSLLQEVAREARGRQRLVFYCMYGEPRSRLCALKLTSDRDETVGEQGFGHTKSTQEADLLEIGFLVGGIHAWVNHFALNGTNSLEKNLVEFDSAAWKRAEGQDSLIHASESTVDDLLSMWGSSAEISQSLRRARTLLATSEDVMLEAVNAVANWQQNEANGAHGLVSPSDIDFEHDHLIGSGSSAVVIKASHRPTGDKLAVKIINVDDPSHRKEVLNSLAFFMGLMKKEPPEGIMRLRGVSSEAQKVFLILDFMNLGPISTLLSLQLKRVPSSVGIGEPLLQHTMRQAVNGLQVLHGQDVLHRDIKPENVLVNSRGEVRIADFGLCMQLEAGQEKMSEAVGTQGYFSPQRSKGKAYSSKEDVWSLGIILYELAIGKHPFGEKSESVGEFYGTLWEKMEAEPGETAGFELPEKGTPGVPDFSAHLREVVSRTLRKRPSLRYTAEELAAHPFWHQMDSQKSQAVWDKWLVDVAEQLRQGGYSL